MNSNDLIKNIKKDLENYPIDYMKKKAQDNRYPDNIYKYLAIYNSNTYDEIFQNEVEDFEINDTLLKNMENDLDNYLEINGSDKEDNKFTKALSLYLTFISKKPLHPVGDSKTHQVYESNGIYYCKDRVKYLKDDNSLCKYCVSKKANFFQF